MLAPGPLNQSLTTSVVRKYCVRPMIRACRHLHRVTGATTEPGGYGYLTNSNDSAAGVLYGEGGSGLQPAPLIEQTACLDGVSLRLGNPKDRQRFISRTLIELAVWTLPEDVRRVNVDTGCSASRTIAGKLLKMSLIGSSGWIRTSNPPVNRAVPPCRSVRLCSVC